MRTMAEEMLSRINAEIKLPNYDNDITTDNAKDLRILSCVSREKCTLKQT